MAGGGGREIVGEEGESAVKLLLMPAVDRGREKVCVDLRKIKNLNS